MKVAICVPWRGGNPGREKVWKMVRTHYEGMHLFEGDGDPDKPFNRSAARNDAAILAEVEYEPDVFLFVDADTFIPVAQLEQAALVAHSMNGAAYPYDKFVSMHPVTGETAERKSLRPLPYLPSGNIAISRETFFRVGGWDERFDGWGWEDGALAVLLYKTGFLVNTGGTIVTFEHSRTEGEDPNLVLQGERPAILAEYDEAGKSAEAALAMCSRVRAFGYVKPLSEWTHPPVHAR